MFFAGMRVTSNTYISAAVLCNREQFVCNSEFIVCNRDVTERRGNFRCDLFPDLRGGEVASPNRDFLTRKNNQIAYCNCG
jgi:hypothetical protein